MFVRFVSGHCSHADLSGTRVGLSFCFLSGFLKTRPPPVVAQIGSPSVPLPTWFLQICKVSGVPGSPAGLGLRPSASLLL